MEFNKAKWILYSLTMYTNLVYTRAGLTEYIVASYPDDLGCRVQVVEANGPAKSCWESSITVIELSQHILAGPESLT